MNLLTLREVTKNFGDLRAVDKVNLEIAEGEIFGLLGPNGAGKSTTINLIAGLLESDTGTITVAGIDVKKNPRDAKQLLGLVPQDIALYEDLSCQENVEFFCGLYGLRGSALKKAATEALEFTGLGEKAKAFPHSFSGGMKRRLNIACAIAHKPRLIIMDEPTVGIDPQSRNHILESVRTLNQQGCTVLYTSHYMEEVEAMCPRIAIMDHAKIIAEGSLAELKSLVTDTNIVKVMLSREVEDQDITALRGLPGVKEVEKDGKQLTLTSALDVQNIEAIVAYLAGRRLGLKSVENVVPDLESVFLTLTGRSLRE